MTSPSPGWGVWAWLAATAATAVTAWRASLLRALVLDAASRQTYCLICT
jgi:hypothetical protein